MISRKLQQDRAILVSGDGDFVPASAELKRRGAEVTVIAKKGMLSQQLSEIADDVILLDDLQYQIAKNVSVTPLVKVFPPSLIASENNKETITAAFSRNLCVP